VPASTAHLAGNESSRQALGRALGRIIGMVTHLLTMAQVIMRKVWKQE
jgi:hypothetical protein